MGTEIFIDTGCATFAEVRKRAEEFWGEFEFYISDMLIGVARGPHRPPSINTAHYHQLLKPHDPQATDAPCGPCTAALQAADEPPVRCLSPGA